MYFLNYEYIRMYPDFMIYLESVEQPRHLTMFSMVLPNVLLENIEK